MTGFEVFAYGIFGGLCAEILGLWKLRENVDDNFPIYLKRKFYWFVTTLMIVMGGGLTYAYAESGISFIPILAINVGATAPLIVKHFASNSPPQINQ